MQRRRKKRCPNRGGTRNVEVERGGGAAGSFGITISGQKPCIISSISKNSPADLAGLRAGDFLISINGLNVSKLQHEIIVQLINAHPKIWLSIADNYYSDSSDEDACHSPAGRSFSGDMHAQRMRPKYNGNKLKGPRPTPQAAAHLPNANNYELLMPSSRPPLNHHNNFQPSTSAFVHNGGQYKRSALDNYYGGPRTTATIHERPFIDNSVLIDTDYAPSLEYRIIVGYLGTIEMPGTLAGPRLQIVRQCIKKMRQEKRQPVAVLMTILPHCMTLRNANNQILATYAANRMSYVSNGSQTETERSPTNFGLITTAYYNAQGVMVSPTKPSSAIGADAVVSNSCHVFMVNQKIVDHRVHFEKLSQFKIRCTRDPISNLCLEFPKEADYVVNLIRSMYTLNVNEEQLNRVARNRAAAAVVADDRNEAAALSNSPQPSNHSEITTTSSNSDSGIGFHNDCTNICDRILVVDFPGLRTPANNYEAWQNLNVAHARPTGIATDRDLCPIEGNLDFPRESREARPEEYSARKILAMQGVGSENKLTVRAMPFPKPPAPAPTTPTRKLDFEERAVDVPVDDGDDGQEKYDNDDFIFRQPIVPPPSAISSKSAKQRLNFLTSKLSPKVFGPHRSRAISQSCENICSPVARRELSEEMSKCGMNSGSQDDEYIDIWGSVSAVNEQDCQRLYSEIDAQRQHFLEGAISEPNMAKQLDDDLIENCVNFSRNAGKGSPFRRYGKISSSFRSQLTATEAKKMLTSSNLNPPGQQNQFPDRPRSYAESEVYQKTDKSTESANRKSSSGKSKDEDGKKTQVLDWSTSLEALLGDIYGVHAFAEFLRKEFSAENIYFWTACERYKQLQNVSDRFHEAQKIFAKHLEKGAPEPVNIDSKATSKTLEQLQMANIDLFDAAQKQIFNLMKFDSYARFIKSDIYKQCLECEMKKLPPPYPENRVLDPALSCHNNEMVLQGQSANASPVKLKKSLSNAEDRRRKSLLPWHRKSRSKSKDRNEAEKKDSGSIYSSRSSLSSFDAVLESTESHRSQLCRVILPNGATTIVQTKATESIRELVLRLLDKRGLSYTCFDVFVGDSNKPTDLEAMSTRIAGKQVNIEQRVTFKLDLPNKKVISVKSKPEKVLEEVLRPILHKYQYSLDDVLVQVRDKPAEEAPRHAALVKLMVTEVDGWRLIISNRTEAVVHKPTLLHEITNRVFNEIMPQQQVDGGQLNGKKMCDYMNCRFTGAQRGMMQSCLPQIDAANEEDEEPKRSVIAKWTAGADLQSPTKTGGEVTGRMVGAGNALHRDPNPHELNYDGLPPLAKTDERPTPAPRHSITKNSLQKSLTLNSSQDSGILSNRTSSSHGDNSLSHSSTHDALDQLKSPPPPLPPKPKVIPILRGQNWGGSSFV